MLTRNQIFLRALLAGILAGLAASAYLVWKQRTAPPPPQFPITLPQTVSWANRSVTLMPDGSERALIEAFAGDGKNFRLEVAFVDKSPVVWVYDGRGLSVNVTIPEKPVDELDPRNTVLNAYETLPSFQYHGVERVGEHNCWVFEQNESGLRSRFWIDIKTSVPRQIIIQYPDGRKDTQTYVDLPSHRTLQPGLFDRSNLSPMLVPSAEAMLGN